MRARVRLYIYKISFKINLLIYQVLGLCTVFCSDGTPLCDYNGTIAVTSGGRTCQKWTEHYPHDHNMESWVADERMDRDTLKNSVNYCRTFKHYLCHPCTIPWCYTTDPQLRRQTCGETICKGNGNICRFMATWSLYTGLKTQISEQWKSDVQYIPILVCPYVLHVILWLFEFG